MKTRTDYRDQLDMLGERVARLGVLAASDIRATSHVIAGEEGVAEGVEASRRDMHQLQQGIEASCMELMLLQQPVASDLRLVTGSFRLVSDLVRIDEMARDVCVLIPEVPEKALSHVEQMLPEMADEVATMVEEATGAFLTSDVAGAQKVFSADDSVDALYLEVEDIVVDLIKDGGVKARALPELLMVAKYYERMGDHAQRVADWAVFRVEGEHASTKID